MLRPGDVIADRYWLGRLAGQGGMGEVWRAVDQTRDRPVALKHLGQADLGDPERFAREIRVLESLRHPAIVEYVDHGVVERDGSLFLVMEWLEGEDLSARLKRIGLTRTESLVVARRIAEALAVAHAAGVVHRDIKPSNIFLEGGRPEGAKLLDFGIARLATATRSLTRTGQFVGTPGYMSPEQARSLASVDARADVFSLGAVLFECLAARAAFVSEHFVGLLAKVLFEDPPRLREIQPATPAALDELVGWLMAKDVAARPPNGAAVLSALDELVLDATVEMSTAPRPSMTAPEPSTLTERELRFCTMLIAAPQRREKRRSEAPTRPDRELDRTMVDDEPRGAWGAVLARLAELDGRAETLGDGTVVCMFGGARSATDHAARAARAALSLRSAPPIAALALASGRADDASVLPVGEAIDRAVALVRDSRAAGRILVDDTTAGLLSRSFEVHEGILTGLRDDLDAPHPVLGRLTPFVGREREESALLALFDECAAEPRARVALVSGPPGIGKSRLRAEVVRRIRERSARAVILAGRCDELGAGTPFGLLASVLRGTLGLAVDGRPDRVRESLRERVPDGPDADRTVRFLGHLVGLAMSEGAPEAAAGRDDPRLHGHGIRRAIVDWLDAETLVGPVVLTLDDVQWSDAASLEAVSAALRTLRDRPLLVIGFGRPETARGPGDPWAARGALQLDLDGLSRRAAAELVQSVLGPRTAAADVDRLVGLSDGNAFFLEELVRAAAEGRGEVPGAVVAMACATFEGLPAQARRILRAASVFGRVFWAGAVQAMLGSEGGPTAVDVGLRDLLDREIVTALGSSRFEREQELAFRHSLLREAAFAALTDADRSLAHRLAAEWLEARGEVDDERVAEHWLRGGAPDHAIGRLGRAAAKAIAGNDCPAALRCVETAIAGGAEGPVKGRLLLERGRAHLILSRSEESTQALEEALDLVQQGSDDWCAVLGLAGQEHGRLGRVERSLQIAGRLLEALDRGERSGALVAACGRVATVLMFSGQVERARELLARGSAVLAITPDPVAEAHLWRARSRDPELAARPADQIATLEKVGDTMGAIGDMANSLVVRGTAQMCRWEAGRRDGVVERLRDLAASSSRLGIAWLDTGMRHLLGWVLIETPSTEEGVRLHREALALHPGDDPLTNTLMRACAAIGLVRLGRYDEAEDEARAAISTGSVNPGLDAVAHSALARALLGRGRTGDALVAARQARERIASAGERTEWGDAIVRSSWLSCLEAAGAAEELRTAAPRERAWLLARAATLPEDWREGFLHDVPDHARLLELASA